MACIPLPAVTPPVLPAPFSIAPPAPPAISVALTACCKLSVIPPLTIPIPIPPLVLNPAVIATINAALQTVDAYLDALALPCPRE